MNWQPIETAQKVEGVFILAFNKDATDDYGRSLPYAVVEWLDIGEGRWGVTRDDGMGSNFSATHWAPFQPPTS